MGRSFFHSILVPAYFGKKRFQKRKRMSGTEKNGLASELLKDSRGSSHSRRLSLSLSSLSLSGDLLNHSYSMCSSSSSSNSPPWSPYCSPATKSQVTIPFSWEDKPGVPKHHKSPTPRRSFQELPPPPQSEFSDAEAFQLERRPRRRPKKRSNDVDPFVSALVACTKQQAAAAAMSKDGRTGPRKQFYGYGGSTYSCIKSCAVTTDAQIAIPSRARQSSRQSNDGDDDDWRIKKQNALAIISSDHRRQRSHEQLLYYEAHSDSAKFLHSDPKQLQRSEPRDMVPHKRQLRPAFMESWDVELHKTLVRH